MALLFDSLVGYCAILHCFQISVVIYLYLWFTGCVMCRPMWVWETGSVELVIRKQTCTFVNDPSLMAALTLFYGVASYCHLHHVDFNGICSLFTNLAPHCKHWRAE